MKLRCCATQAGMPTKVHCFKIITQLMNIIYLFKETVHQYQSHAITEFAELQEFAEL